MGDIKHEHKLQSTNVLIILDIHANELIGCSRLFCATGSMHYSMGCKQRLTESLLWNQFNLCLFLFWNKLAPSVVSYASLAIGSSRLQCIGCRDNCPWIFLIERKLTFKKKKKFWVGHLFTNDDIMRRNSQLEGQQRLKSQSLSLCPCTRHLTHLALCEHIQMSGD